MFTTRFAPRRLSLRVIAAMAMASGFLTSCSTVSTPALPGQEPDVCSPLVKETPVASADRFPAGSFADSVRRRGELIVGGTTTAPLFSLEDPTTGKLTGFDACLSQMLAKYVVGEPRTRLTQVTTDTREALLQNHAVDVVVATYTITPARATKIDFAGPYYESGIGVLTKKDDNTIHDVADLNGRNVVTQSSSTAAQALASRAPQAKVTLFGTNDECLAALRQGRADAYVIDQALLIGAASRNSDVKVAGLTITREPYGIGTAKGTGMKELADDFLHRIQDAGLESRLWKGTVGTVVAGDAPRWPVIGSGPA